MTPTSETFEPTIAPPAKPYYDRLTDESAIQTAKEWVDEWSYEDDAHGYCHNRSVIARLIKLAERGDVE